uniref:Uncharacterized protein n=1 Tax=Cajanus cajan TaxID=3821 RepID=A0A151SDH4_CAJCA|nr:hypothetical protein KK1_025223 [Cajanus cajan]
MQFLTCLRSIRFDLRCFGSFATEEDEDEEEVEVEEEENHVDEASRTVFSKWFMVLQEDQGNGVGREEREEREEEEKKNVVVMRYDSDFYDISSDVAKETWIVGGIRDLMSRTRSCKR